MSVITFGCSLCNMGSSQDISKADARIAIRMLWTCRISGCQA